VLFIKKKKKNIITDSARGK